MTAGRPFVSEGAPRLRHELPGVAGWPQSHFEDAERVVVACNPSRVLLEQVVTSSAGADHELADAARAVGAALRAERCVALVVVVVTGQDDVGVRVVERLPE